MTLDPIRSISPGDNRDVASIAKTPQPKDTSKVSEAKRKTDGNKAPKLDSKFLTQIAPGVLQFIHPDTTPTKASWKKRNVETTEPVKTVGEKRAKAAVSVGGKCIIAGVALSETGVGVALLVAGVAMDLAAIAYGVKKGYGTDVTLNAVSSAASCIPVFGSLIQKGIEAI